MTERSATMAPAYTLAGFSLVMLVFYISAQATLAVVLGSEHSDLKLVLESQLLFLGVILHIQWRKVESLFQTEGLPRPWWVVAADAVSFVITFWALWVLASVLSK